jgi:hypothetical protein
MNADFRFARTRPRRKNTENFVFGASDLPCKKYNAHAGGSGPVCAWLAFYLLPSLRRSVPFARQRREK